MDEAPDPNDELAVAEQEQDPRRAFTLDDISDEDAALLERGLEVLLAEAAHEL